MPININIIEDAYCLAKKNCYYENLNIFMRQRFAEFEKSETNLKTCFEQINVLLNFNDTEADKNLAEWLKNIDFFILPKNVDREENRSQNDQNRGSGLFISNVRESEKYQVSKVNYFINVPVAIHILDVLWSIYIGSILDSELTKDSYGNRLHPSIKDFDTNEQDKSKNLFKVYINQYNTWRNKAIDVATQISKEGDDIVLLSLDLQSFFYNVNVDFEKISVAIEKYYKSNNEQKSICHKLNNIIKKVYAEYHSKIAKFIKLTHKDSMGKKYLPIGLTSSPIMANWYLKEFDEKIIDEVRPAYYGRYVDDILIVIKRPNITYKDTITTFIEKYMSSVLKVDNGDEKSYSIRVDDSRIPIQKDKIILHFFDHNHSRAGLEIFKKELDEISSAFKFLPDEHLDSELDKFAYDILYEGSANKLRSIVGIAENETELVKYLASHISAHRISKINNNENVIPHLKQFFKGENALQFHRIWEKIYQYAVITTNYDFIDYFYNYIQNEILKTDSIINNECIKEVTIKLHSDLKLYNDISLGVTLGLLDLESPENFSTSPPYRNPFKKNRNKLSQLVSFNGGLHFFAWQFRVSNLIRHHLVAWPLANYTNTFEDLTTETPFINSETKEIETSKTKYSPRFIHFDELQIFYLTKFLESRMSLEGWINSLRTKYEDIKQNYVFGFKVEADKETNNILRSYLEISGKNFEQGINIAIANLVVKDSDIVNAVRKDKKPNLSQKRKKQLNHILNTTTKEEAKLLVMPEVCIPVSWLPHMVRYSRANQIGLIFGLEHWVINDIAYNIIIEVLPYKVSDKYKSCVITARIKNHYAPEETNILGNLRLQLGNASLKPKVYYHKVSWEGLTFTTYNCFELSDISHRALFKSEIDLLVACVWNRDTTYYDSILDSAVRDLHCYTIQANTSQYGGSCVLRPTKTDFKKMLYVKGGENSCVLTTYLDIKALRNFQFKSRPDSKDIFKHLPPGYDSDAVLKR